MVAEVRYVKVFFDWIAVVRGGKGERCMHLDCFRSDYMYTSVPRSASCSSIHAAHV